LAPAKAILITGCSTGIGYASAIELRQRGHTVITSARKENDVNRLRQEGFLAVQIDLADSQSIQDGFNEALGLAHGKIDALFNNAAFGQPGAVEDLSRETLRFQFETNVFGTHELTHLAIPHMRKQGHGRIIYNSSILGLVAMPFRGAYNASKYALEGLADTLRLELHGSNISVSLIEPGPILTHFRQNSYALYKQNIAIENSVHKAKYKVMETRLQQEGNAVPFTLPAKAVADKVIHAVESAHPNAHYYVTFPTYLLAYLKRVLPTSWLDNLLRRV
jgi:NAD(P)-dependent dehydrogenase (short-subunit alcohol dehydrogenase family)